MENDKYPEKLREYVKYSEESESGIICIKSWSNFTNIGDSVGSLDKHTGYYKCKLFGKLYKVHRVIWWLFNDHIPDNLQIDHINGNRSDNRIENLRLVPRVINSRNRSKNKNNSTGISNIEYVEFYSKLGTLIRKFYVRMRLTNGKSISRSFSCEKYGDWDALCMAVSWKNKVFIERNNSGAQYTDRHGY